MSPGDQPAFPYAFQHEDDSRFTSGGFAPGMTLRQHYAGLAMQGLLADHKDHSGECADGETCPRTVARLAVLHADELLKALEKFPLLP